MWPQARWFAVLITLLILNRSSIQTPDPVSCIKILKRQKFFYGLFVAGFPVLSAGKCDIFKCVAIARIDPQSPKQNSENLGEFEVRR